MDVGLARVSTLDQDPQLQINALKRVGCDPILEEKQSGVSEHRPVRDRALSMVQRGDTLTVWKLDRLGRSLIDLHTITSDLRERGVAFRSLTESIVTSHAQGRLFFAILAAFAEFERATIIERIRAGKERRAAEGKHPGGNRRFGVEADHETVVEAEAELLREAARRLLAGEAASRIVDSWNDRGLKAYGGGRWQVTPLRHQLTNPRVAAILGQDTYEAMVRLFRAPGRQRLGAPARHLLSGILACQCGQPMYLVNRGKGGPAYRCRKAEGSGGRSQGCGGVSVSMAAADRWMAGAFIAAFTAPDSPLPARLAARLEALQAGDVTPEQLDRDREELGELDLILPTRFATDAHRARHTELQRRIREAETRLHAEPELAALLDLPRTEAELRASWESWDVPERRAWVKRLLERVVVKRGARQSKRFDESRLDPRWRL
jgi:DNA invertase Pin-like site-specific DNA recombinase